MASPHSTKMMMNFGEKAKIIAYVDLVSASSSQALEDGCGGVAEFHEA